MYRLIFSLFLVAACTNKETQLGDVVLVKVNDNQLNSKEFSQRLIERLRDFDALAVKDENTLKTLKDAVARDFIVHSVTQTWAHQQGLFVRKEHLETEINNIRGQYPDDLSFRRALSEQGLGFKQWAERLKFSMLQKQVVEKLKSKVQAPSEEDLKAYYKNNPDEFQRTPQIKLRQILLATENNAKRVHRELRKGKKFGDLAKKYSVAPEASKAGLIGWIERGTLDIFDKAFHLRIGRRSQVLKSPYGFHIFEVLAKRGAKRLGFAEVRSEILQKMLRKREQAVYSSWLENQIRLSKVYKNDGVIESLSVETRHQ